MTDEIFDRSYQAGRAELNIGVHRTLTRLARFISSGFATLNRIQFAAPWRDDRDTGLAHCA